MCKYIILILFCISNLLGCGGSENHSVARLILADLEYPSELRQISKNLNIEGSLYKTFDFSETDKISGPVKATSQNSDNTNLAFSFADVGQNGTILTSP